MIPSRMIVCSLLIPGKNKKEREGGKRGNRRETRQKWNWHGRLVNLAERNARLSFLSIPSANRRRNVETRLKPKKARPSRKFYLRFGTAVRLFLSILSSLLLLPVIPPRQHPPVNCTIRYFQ